MSCIAQTENLCKSYGGVSVLENVSLNLDCQELMVLYGLPSSGKSVLLRLLMGLETPDSGQVILRGTDASATPAKDRGLRYIPQDFALFPNFTVFENIAYPLRLSKQPKAEVDQAVTQAAEMLSISEHLHKLPTQLSGGQKQRVAIARGLVMKADLYLFDDPLAGLDFKLREKLIDDLKDLQEELGACFVYATSDPIEAMALGTRVAILHDGTIKECAAPEELYFNPRDASAMEILGFPRANIVAGSLNQNGGGLECRTGLFNCDLRGDGSGHKDVLVGFRPEELAPAGNGMVCMMPLEVGLSEDLGAEEIIYLKADSGGGNAFSGEIRMIRPSGTGSPHQVGKKLKLGIKPDALMIFDKASGRRLELGA